MIAANKITNNRGRWRAWSWLCPWAMVGLAVAILFVVGLSIWTALLAAMLLVCPAIMIWGAIKIRQHNNNGEVMSLSTRRLFMADENPQSGGWLRSRTGLIFFGFAAIAGFFLWEEHKAHLLGALPYVLLLLCPLMHFFHGGHGAKNTEHKDHQ